MLNWELYHCGCWSRTDIFVIGQQKVTCYHHDIAKQNCFGAE